VDDVQTAQKYQALGVQFITLAVDMTIFSRACDQIVMELNTAQGHPDRLSSKKIQSITASSGAGNATSRPCPVKF
jgi:hypothetical protein